MVSWKAGWRLPSEDSKCARDVVGLVDTCSGLASPKLRVDSGRALRPLYYVNKGLVVQPLVYSWCGG